MKRAHRSLGTVARRRTIHAVRASRERWFHPHIETLERRCLLSAVPSLPQIFYDGSFWDNGPGISSGDDNAIAPDKSAYLPDGNPSTFGNVSGYFRGINGLAIDLVGAHGTITASDFKFKVGNDNAPGNWTSVTAPVTLTVRGGEGPGGADRIELLWSNNAIEKQWLEVIMEANENTGLSTSYVFFVGSAVGDSGAADTSAYGVTPSDEISARNDPHGIGDPATKSNVNDFNRDSQVNSSDQIIARNNGTGLGNQLKFLNVSLTLPTLTASLTNDTGPDGQPNSDGITTDVTMGGTLTDAYTVSSFKAGINGGPVTTDCMSLLQPDGTFMLSPSFITAMNGGSLPDGAYTLRLESLDAQGLSTSTTVSFTKKTSIATPQTPDLVAASDSGASTTDNITNDNTPTFLVTAENGSLVKVLVDDVVVAQGTATPTVQLTTSTLADGTKSVKVTAQDGAGNSATSGVLNITLSTSLPTIEEAATAAAFTDDVTPHVTVTNADGPLGLPNGTQVNFDVDLNFDNDFADSGELNYTQATLYNGGAYFQVTPAIPAPISTSTYVMYRARVTDIAGNEGTSPEHSLRIDNQGNTFLSGYVNSTADPYYYDLPNSTAPTSFTGTGYTATVYDLRSQNWRTLADVDRTEWQHWVTVIVPTGNLAGLESTALLRITSGNNTTDTRPTTADGNLVSIATTLNMMVIDLRMVPNQPLTFTGDPGNPRSEDEIIAYSFNQYILNMGVGPDWTTWPALLPMVKSAKRTLDMVQAVDTGLTGGKEIVDFVVTGGSKRGWTTWLTAAVDNRIKAIIPAVIDVLNMDEQMMHHHAFYSDSPPGIYFDDGFSVWIQDYVAYDIPENVQTVQGQELGRVVDPYRYLNNGHFNIPKLILNGSEDEFFVPDSSHLYFSDLPGTQNYLRYIPNNGHGLNSTQTTISAKSFMNAVINNVTMPTYSWTIDPDGQIRVQTDGSPTVLLWQETNPNYRDFRGAVNPWVYTSHAPGTAYLTNLGGGQYLTSVPTPGAGATAFFVEMTWTSPISGSPYIFTTEIKVASNIPKSPWPFYTEAYVNGVGGGGSGGSGDGEAAPAASEATASGSASSSGDGGADLNLVTSSLAPAASSPGVAAEAPASTTASATSSGQNSDRARQQLLGEWSSLDEIGEVDDGAETDEPSAIDVALGDLDALALD